MQQPLFVKNNLHCFYKPHAKTKLRIKFQRGVAKDRSAAVQLQVVESATPHIKKKFGSNNSTDVQVDEKFFQFYSTFHLL